MRPKKVSKKDLNQSYLYGEVRLGWSANKETLVLLSFLFVLRGKIKRERTNTWSS